MIWDYSLTTSTIWTSFDNGQVEANTYEEACAKALEQLKYDVDKVNTVFKHCDITEGFSLEMDYDQLEVSLADPQPVPVAPEPEVVPFTKFSQRNLEVIQNFLVYSGLEEQYSQTALNYIAEDHVDGEGSDSAHREIALGSELIRDYVDIDGANGKFAVFANHITGLIYAVSNDETEYVRLFKLTKPQEVIEVEHRDEILDYCLAKKTPEDEVCIGDIFVHGKYVEQLN